MHFKGLVSDVKLHPYPAEKEKEKERERGRERQGPTIGSDWP